MPKSSYPQEPTRNNIWNGRYRQQHHNGSYSFTNYPNEVASQSNLTNNQHSTGGIQGQCPMGGFTGGPFIHDNRR